MKVMLTSFAIVSLLNVSAGVGPGGSGPVSITRFHGQVLIKPMNRDCSYRKNFDAPEVTIEAKWAPVKKGEYLGEFLLKTGSRSWAHLNGRAACVDGGSLVQISSGADIGVFVKRGRLTVVDGKNGPAICRAGQQRLW